MNDIKIFVQKVEVWSLTGVGNGKIGAMIGMDINLVNSDIFNERVNMKERGTGYFGCGGTGHAELHSAVNYADVHIMIKPPIWVGLCSKVWPIDR